MRYENKKENTQNKQDIRLARASILRAIEQLIIENEKTNQCNKHLHKANKPSVVKTYKGRIFKGEESESSDGEEVLSEVSDFSDSSDDELLNSVVNYDNNEILNGKLESIEQEMHIHDGIYEELYSDETFNTTIWDDTFEITKTKQI